MNLFAHLVILYMYYYYYYCYCCTTVPFSHSSLPPTVLLYCTVLPDFPLVYYHQFSQLWAIFTDGQSVGCQDYRQLYVLTSDVCDLNPCLNNELLFLLCIPKLCILYSVFYEYFEHFLPSAWAALFAPGGIW